MEYNTFIPYLVPLDKVWIYMQVAIGRLEQAPHCSKYLRISNFPEKYRSSSLYVMHRCAKYQ